MVRTKNDTRRHGTPRRAGRGLIAALAALMLAPAAASAAEDPLLARMAGDWIGRGTFKSSPSADPELVYCRITNTLGDGGTVLEQKGRCAVATNSGRVAGSIAAKGSGVYQGSLESLATRGTATLNGRASSNQIAFSAEFVDSRTRQPGTASIQAVVGDGQYRLVSKNVDPRTRTEFVASDIQFTRQ